MIWDIIKEHWQLIGQAPLCNGQAETTFQIFGLSFFLCYRCTAICIGMLLTICVFSKLKAPFFTNPKQQATVIILFLLLVITDGSHYFFHTNTTNLLRVLTGGFGGIGLGLLVDLIFPKRYVNENRIN